jgi:hypothetical protein
MVTLLDAFGLAVILLVNTAAVALLTRFFRVRLHTTWGGALYSVVISPVALLVLTLVLSGVLGLGPDLGSVAAVVLLVMGLPLALGLTFDYVWMPDPDEVDLPQEWDEDRQHRQERREERLRR